MKIIDKIQIMIKKVVSTKKEVTSFLEKKQNYEKTIIFYAIFYTIAAAVFIIYWLIKK